MAANPYETYKQQEILSSSRGDLLLMLYDGCIKQLRLARMHLAESNMEGSHNSLMKAQAILAHLMNDLDMSYEISIPLMQLYRFYHQELTEANIHKDDSKIVPVLDMLADLRNTWQIAVRSQKTGSAAEK
jgi:flagellar secretion chaperone FliS